MVWWLKLQQWFKCGPLGFVDEPKAWYFTGGHQGDGNKGCYCSQQSDHYITGCEATDAQAVAPPAQICNWRRTVPKWPNWSIAAWTSLASLEEKCVFSKGLHSENGNVCDGEKLQPRGKTNVGTQSQRSDFATSIVFRSSCERTAAVSSCSPASRCDVSTTSSSRCVSGLVMMFTLTRREAQSSELDIKRIKGEEMEVRLNATIQFPFHFFLRWSVNNAP